MPLSGITVVDLSRFLPGPYCSLLLADYGAEVICVEQPHEVAKKDAVLGRAGLDRRGQEEVRAREITSRNKRSVLLDLRDPDGREALLDLLATADVLLHDYRPGVLDASGLDYASLASEFPRLVYCAISLCGETGPYRDLPGHDSIALALAGQLPRFGDGETPSVPGVPANDILTGAHAAFGILAALRERDRSGHGQAVSVAMSDCALAAMTSVFQRYLISGRVPPRNWQGGNTGLWKTRDGRYICTTDVEPAYWRKFCVLVERPDLVPLGHDPARREELDRALESLFAQRSRDEWFALLLEGQTQAAPVYTVEEALRDPHAASRGSVVEIDDPRFGAVVQIGPLVRMSRTPGRIRFLGHLPGADNDELVRTRV